MLEVNQEFRDFLGSLFDRYTIEKDSADRHHNDELKQIATGKLLAIRDIELALPPVEG